MTLPLMVLDDEFTTLKKPYSFFKDGASFRRREETTNEENGVSFYFIRI